MADYVLSSLFAYSMFQQMTGHAVMNAELDELAKSKMVVDLMHEAGHAAAPSYSADLD